MFYTVPATVPLQQLLNDALVLAHQTGHDVFNALDIFDNSLILKELKFGVSTCWGRGGGWGTCMSPCVPLHLMGPFHTCIFSHGLEIPLKTGTAYLGMFF